MKLLQKGVSLLLVLAMLLSLVPATAMASNDVIVQNEQGNYEIINEQGETTEVDESWEEEHPYGMLALGHHQVIVEEGGDTQILKVHRLGGTVGKASAIIQYAPAVVGTEDGGEDPAYAISPEDICIEVEDPLPITAYQAWGEGPAPEPAGTGISARPGVDEVLGQCTILSANTLEAAEDYAWFALYAGNWTPVENSNVAELPVGDELNDLDYRCEYTLNGIRYCTDSYRGVVYEKPESQVIPEAPADLELNPEKTYSELEMSQGDGMSAWLFEVCFAEGETEKEIRITAPEDELPETEEMATFTIVGNVGGEIMESLNTAMITIFDNDADKDPPARFGFTVTEATFDKSEGTARLTVQRSGGLVKTMSVDWTLEDGTAVAGVDYAAAGGSLNFYGYETQKVIEIPLINDQVEDLTQKEFTVRLSNLKGNGGDASQITEEASLCTVRLYNSNTAEELNLASALQNSAEGVDVSANLTVDEGAQVSNQVLDGAQVDGNLPVEDNTTVEWGADVNPNLRMYQYNNGGKINFSGGDWTSTVKESLAITSDGEGKNSTKKNIANMGALYKSISASVRGGAGLCNWWDRLWHGNNEYAYTYFSWDPYWSSLYNGEKDCDPVLTENGSKINLSWYDPFSVSDTLPYKTGDGSLTLGVKKNDSCPSDDNINASADVTLTRRTFTKDFRLNIYTANDPDTTAEVAKYADSDYAAIIKSVAITEGGTNGGLLYEGSSVQIQLGDTHLSPVSAYLVDASGSTVKTGALSGTTATFNNLILDPNGSYTFRLVLDRTQDIKIDLSTSANISDDGSYTEGAFDDAFDLLLENSETDLITVGYTARNDNTFDSTISERDLSLSGRTLSGSIITLEKTANLQWINFNMPEEDSFVFNGAAYAGNEKIPLNIADIKTNDLQFYYYAAQYKTMQRPMNAILDATAVYYDGNANGMIDGYFDRSTGSFVLDEDSGDEFVAFPEDGDYAETIFAPVVDEDGTVHQYFFRAYYTANPVSLEVPEGKEDEKMQVMPAFITDVTDSGSYASLTEEQQQYRVIVSGETSIKESASVTTTGYSADNHAKYGAEASAYSYVDIPLGGDTSPARAVTADLADGRYTIDGQDCMVLDGFVYTYSATGANNLGEALYTWEPDFRGSLLYPYSDPASILYANSMTGEDVILKGAELVNGYLGAFANNDTFALMVHEQTQTTAQIRAGQNASAGDGVKETVTRGTIGSFPNPSHLAHMGSTPPESQEADNSQYTEYDEITVNTRPKLFAASPNFTNFANITTSGYAITVTVGFPFTRNLYSYKPAPVDPGNTTPAPPEEGGPEDDDSSDDDTTREETTQTDGEQANGGEEKKWEFAKVSTYNADRVADFLRACKNGETGKFAKLYGNELMPKALKFASLDVHVKVSLALVFRYNALDNSFKFEQATGAVHASLTLKLRYRFTPVPIIYVYSLITIAGGGRMGLEVTRVPEHEAPVINDTLTLYTSPQSGQAGSYSFTADKKSFNITFTGKLYVECFNFTDNNKNGIYDDGDTLGDAVDEAVFKPGKIKSDGKKPTNVQIHGWMDGHSIDPVVVKLTPIVESAADATSVPITLLAEVKSMKNDYHFSGLQFEINGSIELGLGVGIEIAKGEVFGQASVGIVFTLADYEGAGEYDPIVFNSFVVRLALGFRLVILGFSYQQDLISYTVGYDVKLDDNEQGVVDSDGWFHSWSALGDSFGGTIEEFSLRHRTAALEEQIENYVNLPQKAEPLVSSNGVAGANPDVPQFFAFDTNAEDFQVSGYGSGSNAFRLMQGGDTGYDYQIVTVEDRNYVVYTGADPNASAVDNTELWLSRLEETDDVYGYVNPIAENGTDAVPYIPVDGDGTGDLEFYAWAEGTKIHALWVSYADATSDEALAEGDVSQHLKNSAYNTVVKHAEFDTADPNATGFGTPELLSDANVNAYYFQPHMAGGAAVVARSVPYSDEALEARMAEYAQYLTDTEDEVTPEQDPHGYMAASREYRLSYERDLAAVYGGNSVLSVSMPGRELSNATTYISTAQAADPANANEIITNLDMAEIDGVYYLSYMTKQDIFERSEEVYTDLSSTYRFYLRTFTIDETDTVVWGEPYLLRTLVNREQSSDADGIYSGGALTTRYQDPGFANLQFLNGRLGDSLKGTEESFRTASLAEAEDFLLFEMNGDTYVIQEKSLKSITGNDGTDTHTGTLSPFFTAKQFYESAGHDLTKARENGESLASGKGEVVIGADGDGNLAAVYTTAIPNTVNNAIYIAYWDPGTGAWSDGVMLAMNHMDVYERAATQDWSDEELKAAYYDEEKGGGLDQFTFSNLQIALGRKSAEEGETTQTPEGDEIHNETSADSAEAVDAELKEKFKALLQENDVTQEQIDAWFESGYTVPNWLRNQVYESAGRYELTQEAEAMGLEVDSSASAPELLILTQGTMQLLDRYEDAEGNITVAPAREEDGSVLPGSVGIYAISYGKGNQQVGNASIQFSEYDFSAGTVLDAALSFTNVGDAAIRGSEDQPIKVRLMLSDNGAASEMAVWEIANNISAGQKVSLDTAALHCAPLPGDLGFGDFFYFTVEEDAAYIESTGGEAYHYDSSSDPDHGCTFDIEIKPELGIENLNASVFAVDKEGNPILHVTFDTANRGSLLAKDPWLQFSYAASYDEEGEPVYAPLDMSKSELYISRQMQIKEETPLRSAGLDNLRLGIVMLRGTEIFNRQDYYLTEEEYDQLLARYYTTYPVSYWEEGEYRGQSYWYDSEVYESAQAAFEAGSAAVAHLSYDWSEEMYYASTYSSLAEAKRAAEADCKAEYILTAQQYSRLSLEEQAAWHPVICVDDELTYYVPTQIKTYEGAWLVYQAALKELNHNLFSHFYRQVEAYVKVSPEMFNAPLNESLNLRVELFSDETSTSYDGSTGLYRSDHAGEYNAVNNAATVALEQTGFILTANKVALNQDKVHLLPVHIRTTTGEAPQIRVLEVVEEGQEKKLSALYFVPHDDSTVPNVLTGHLTVASSSDTGTGVIHVIDEATNTTKAITYKLEPTEQYGINISRENPVIFRNADGSLNTAESETKDWSFPIPLNGGWTELDMWVNDTPLKDDVAVGVKGASVSFFTTAMELEFQHLGDITISSNKFTPSTTDAGSTTDAQAGTVTITGANSGDYCSKVTFDGEMGESHLVTITVAGEKAKVDMIRPIYSGSRTDPTSGPGAPFVYWSMAFPRYSYNTAPYYDQIPLTAYVYDPDGVESVEYVSGTKPIDAFIKKVNENFWVYHLSVTMTEGSMPEAFLLRARDVNGLVTEHGILTTDWFRSEADDPTLVTPKTHINAYVERDNGTQDFLYMLNSPTDYETDESIIVIKGEEQEPVYFYIGVEDGYTDENTEVYYYQFDSEAGAFVEMPSDHTMEKAVTVTENGDYLVRIEYEDGTWAQRMLQVECFEAQPTIEMREEVKDGKTYLNWKATKDPTSKTTLASVTVNGYELLEGSGVHAAQGSEELPFGGDYTVKVTDSKGITAETTLKVNIPVTFPADAITVVDNWSANPLYHRGEAQIDLPKLSGGAYDPTKITKNGHALPPREYTGSYGYFQMVVNGPTEEFSVEDEIIRWIDDIMWRNVEEGPVGALKTANHIIVLQSIYDQKNPKLIAWQFITVRDNRIKISSIDATPSLGTANQDGSITAGFEGGHTGKYEVAILPGKNLTIDDFKASDVVWKSAGDDGTVAFEDLADGTWQLAVRARYDDDPNAYQSVNANDWHGAVLSDPIVVADGEMTADEAVQAAKEAQLAAEAAQLAAEKAAADARVAQAAAEEAAKSAAEDKAAAENAKLAAELAKSQAEAAKTAAEAAQAQAEAAAEAAESSNAAAAEEAAKAAREALNAAQSAGAAAESASEAAQAAAAAQTAQSKAEAAQTAAEEAAASSAEDREGAEAAQAAAELAQSQAEAAKAAAETAKTKAEEAKAAAEAANVKAAEEAAKSAASANESAQSASAAAGSAADAALAAKAAQDAQAAAEAAQKAAEEAAASSAEDREGAEAAQAAAELAQSQAEAAKAAAETAKTKAEEAKAAAEAANVTAAEEAAKSAQSANESAQSASAAAGSAADAALAAKAAQEAQQAAEEAQAAAEEAAADSETNKEAAEAAQAAAEEARSKAEDAQAASEAAQKAAEDAAKAAESSNVEAAEEAAASAASAKASAESAAAAAKSAAEAAESAIVAQAAQKAAEAAQAAAESAQAAAETARSKAEAAQAAAEAAAASGAEDREGAEAAQAAAELAQSQAEAAQAAAELAQSQAEAAKASAEAANVKAAEEAAKSAAASAESAKSASAAAGSAADAALAAKAAQEAQQAAEEAQAAAEEAATDSETNKEAAEAAQAAAEEARSKAEDAQAASEAAQKAAEDAAKAAESSNVEAAEEAAASAASAKASAESAAAAAKSAAEAAESAIVAQAAQKAAEAAQVAAESAQAAAETAQSKAEAAQAAAEAAAASSAEDREGAEAAQKAAELAQSQAEAAKSAAETAKTKAEEAQAAAEAANVKAAEEAAKSAAASAESAKSASAAAGSAADAALAAKAAQEAQQAAEEAQAAAEEAAADSETNKEAAEAAQAAAEEAQSKAEDAQAASEAAQKAAEDAAKAAESSNVEAAEEAAASAASAKASAESAAAAAKSAAEAAASATAAQAAQKAAEDAQAAAEAAQLAAEEAQSKAEAAQAAAEAAAASSAEDREGAERAQAASELAQAQAEAAQAAAEEAQSKAEAAQAAAEEANVKTAEEAAKSAVLARETAQAAAAAAGSAADAAEAAEAAQTAQLAAEEAQAAAEAAAASSASDKKAAQSAKISAELAYAQAKAAKAGAEAAQNAAEIAAAKAQESNVEAAEEAAKSAASAKASAESAAAAAASAKASADSARQAQEAQAKAELAQKLAEDAARKAKEEADRIARESALNLAKTVAVIELNELAQELSADADEEYRSALAEAAKAQRELLLAAADEAALAEALEEAKLALSEIAAKQCAAVVFDDVEKDAWYHEAVDYVLNEGMMNGTGDGSFAPNGVLSRAMLVQILYNIEGKPAVETELKFSDVSEGAWYYDAVMWAAENGIVQGIGNGTFAPEQAISREQMVTILYRYAGTPEVVDPVLTFADADAVSEWAFAAVVWAAENGVVQGVGNNRFDPAGSTTRASAAQVMMNYYNK